ncbi:adenylyl-sulfate kinase [Streptomyces sp. NPDC059629]|uniref:adenylyl-sulfate kinase n=1 Tax=Streptomyces sp. NPDC059629 TaxID=3346889 RepID=UPI0036C58924
MRSRFCTCWPGATVLLTGLPNAGKTTIANELASRLRGVGRRVVVLDGDRLRATGVDRPCRRPSASGADVRRLGLVAEVLARNGVLALMPLVAPHPGDRARVRARHRESSTPFLEVHVATPVGVCAERDVRGAHADAVRFSGPTRADASHECAAEPDLVVPGHGVPVMESATLLMDLLRRERLAG